MVLQLSAELILLLYFLLGVATLAALAEVLDHIAPLDPNDEGQTP